MTREVGRRGFLGATGGVLVGGRLLTSATGTSAATQQATEEWRQFGYDDANTGYAPDNTGPVEDITEQWSYQTGGAVNSSPAVADGTVYVGSSDDNVYALDAADGTEQWSYQTGDDVFSSPAVADGTVYVGSNDNNVYALDAADGTEQWSYQTGSEVFSSPAVADGTVYVGSFNGRVYALDAADGTEQ